MDRWQNYKELELVPDRAPAPKAKLHLAPLVAAWRWLLNSLAREQVYEQRTDYLERCWETDYSEADISSSQTELSKLWKLMD